MDEKDKKIAELTAQLENANKEVTTLKATVEQNVKDIAIKDKLIEQKTADIIGARQETQKLKALTDEEKEKLSAKEIELHNQTLRLQEEQEKFKNDQQAFQTKERESRISQVLKKYGSEKNPEVAKKVREAMDKIKGSEDAFTPEDIETFAEQAYGMIGSPKVDAMTTVMNGSGDVAGNNGSAPGFAESQEGKGLAASLNLNIGKPEAK